MAAIVEQQSGIRSDRSFFLIMAVLVTVTVAVGFGVDITRPQIAFATAPLYVHLHAVVFSLWPLFYLTQNLLVVRDNIALHRTLGIFGAMLAAAMLVVGLQTTILSLQLHRVPPFFTPAVFLVLDATSALGFAGLVAAALVLRRDGATHKRLMLAATLLVMGPAWGRLLPMPLMGVWNTWAVTGAVLVYMAGCALYDRATRGSVHPAWGWGFGVVMLAQILVATAPYTPPVLNLVARLAA